ncbi:MAG TPA: nickel insertion protein, partial [Vicinamibacterales bacterium]|nr:nickel insertion protein [Vicinamibacterales bacterium]
MSRVLYFDCFSGISGDMTLGALIDAGLPFADLQKALGSLALGDAHVHVDRVLRTGVSAAKFSVHTHPQEHGHEHGAGSHQHGVPHRSLAEIFGLIDRAALSASARGRA